MNKPIDLTNKRFGRLTVVRRVENNKYGSAMWLCKCDCGNETIVTSGNLNGGGTTSCGCFKLESFITRSTIHGKSKSKLFNIWSGMKKRCSYKNSINYRLYGERGITVCEDWVSFERFNEWATAHGYKDGLTIDRIDPNGQYEPSNCRWITNKEQQRNKRNNHNLTFNGKTKCLKSWSEDVGINSQTLRCRLKCGWSIEKALTTPVKGR